MTSASLQNQKGGASLTWLTAMLVTPHNVSRAAVLAGRSSSRASWLFRLSKKACRHGNGR